MKTASNRFASAAALLVLSASAAFSQERLVANIPFDFSVGSKSLTAGQY